MTWLPNWDLPIALPIGLFPKLQNAIYIRLSKISIWKLNLYLKIKLIFSYIEILVFRPLSLTHTVSPIAFPISGEGNYFSTTSEQKLWSHPCQFSFSPVWYLKCQKKSCWSYFQNISSLIPSYQLHYNHSHPSHDRCSYWIVVAQSFNCLHSGPPLYSQHRSQSFPVKNESDHITSLFKMLYYFPASPAWKPPFLQWPLRPTWSVFTYYTLLIIVVYMC